MIRKKPDAPSGADGAERSIDGKHMVRLFADPEGGTRAERFLDARDQALVDERMATVDSAPGPRVGDFVIFADGAERRVSYIWPKGDTFPASVQTSDLDAGRYYLGGPGLSYSGSLHPPVSVETLTETGDNRDGDAWIFHHDLQRAHNGVDFKATFRVFRCSLPADDAERTMAEAITSPDDSAAQTERGSR